MRLVQGIGHLDADLDDLADRERPGGEEERFTPLRAVVLAALTLLMLYVIIGMAVEQAGSFARKRVIEG